MKWIILVRNKTLSTEKMMSFFEQRGYQVDTTNMLEFVDSLIITYRDNGIAMVMVDFDFYFEGEGQEFVSRLKSKYPNVFVVAISSKGLGELPSGSLAPDKFYLKQTTSLEEIARAIIDRETADSHPPSGSPAV